MPRRRPHRSWRPKYRCEHPLAHRGFRWTSCCSIPLLDPAARFRCRLLAPSPRRDVLAQAQYRPPASLWFGGAFRTGDASRYLCASPAKFPRFGIPFGAWALEHQGPHRRARALEQFDALGREPFLDKVRPWQATDILRQAVRQLVLSGDRLVPKPQVPGQRFMYLSTQAIAAAARVSALVPKGQVAGG